MLKRFTNFFIYLLLVLMPVQALATANMLVCNSVMQTQAVEQSVDAMPCHQPMTNLSNLSQANTHQAMHSNGQESPCKANCASICSNMCAMTAMPAAIQSSFVLNLTQDFNLNSLPYVSITQPNLQRPPIAFI